ncbi:MAG: hypothetical protein JXR97_02205 [Planctomycetes bacterium]|nr:hypothetical protein [Planctomycetota bacterium]
MDLVFHGTLGGSVAVAERRHACFTIETDGGVYWFDVGEDASRAAHLAGVDILSTRAITLSSMCMNSMGGLPRLLWAIRHENMLRNESDRGDSLIRLAIPFAPPWSGLIEMLEGATGNHFANGFVLEVEKYGDGIVLDDGTMKVRACHNSYMGAPYMHRDWKSYSVRAEGEGKSVVYSGNMHDVSDLFPLLEEPCDILMVGTSHQPVADICMKLKERKAEFGKLVFNNLSAEIVGNPGHAKETAMSILGVDALIPDDGERITL